MSGPVEALYHADPYAKTTTARVLAITGEGGIVPDRSIFYAKGGGQPGDSGRLAWAGGACEIGATVREPDGTLALIPAEPEALPPVGAEVEMRLDWERRHRFMRMHTCLHLLSVVVPLPVTGGQIGAEASRLDFDMPEPMEPGMIQARLGQLIDADHPVTDEWVDEARLDADPGLVKTLRVQPPRGAGRVRLVRIGADAVPVDLQPCGGTHVRSTAEIGTARVTGVKNKGRANRRVTVALD
jgi:misacylated tRNA(Ala) deacylase